MKGATVTVIQPVVHPVSQNLRERRVKVRCLRPKFRIDGRTVQPGEEVELLLGLARDLEVRGHLRIIGDPFEVDTGVRVEVDRRGWSSRY
ncbi:MAG: hypothetical protein Kow00128_10520 [Deltaproteobacteria bacterium]